MGFSLRILVVLLISIVNFSISAYAEEGNNYLSIPDFTIRKVTPQKTFGLSQREEAKINRNETSQLSNIKTASIKEPPKLRYISQSNLKSYNHQKKSALPVEQSKTKVKAQTYSEGANQASEQPADTKNTNLQKVQNSNNATTISETTSQDEFVSKINKINEQNQSSTKGSFKDNKLNDSENSFFRTFSSLSIVLLLIFIFAWVYARVKGINPAAILTGKFSEKDLNRFNVISTSTLGQGKDIHLVEINGKQLVIGSTANNINLLTEIDPEEVEKLKEKKQKTQNYEENHQFDPSGTEFPEINPSEEESFYYESIEDEDFEDSDHYSLKYSEVYKEYINNDNSEKHSDQ